MTSDSMNPSSHRPDEPSADQEFQVEPPLPKRGESAGAVALAALAANLIPLLLLADTLLALSRGWRPRSGLDRWTVGFISLIAVAIAATLLFRSARTFYARNAGKMVVMSGSIALLLLGGQLMFGYAERSMQAPFHHRVPHQHRKFSPQPGAMPGIHGESTYSVNSKGIRGPEQDPKYEHKVLCIGGSTTENVYLDDSETWAQLTMKALNESSGTERYWVGAIGRQGYSTAQHLQYIETREDFSAYDIAVFLIGANDLLVPLNYVPQKKRDPLPAPYWTRTGYYRVAETLRTMATPQANPMGSDPTGANTIIRRKQRAEAPIVRSDESLDAQFEVWRGNYEGRIAKIIEACKQRNVQPLFVTQPTLWSDPPDPEAEALCWAGRIKKTSNFLSLLDLHRYLESMNETLRAVCKQHNAPLVELTHMNGNLEFFYDDFHFTESGARVVASALAEGILQLDEE